MWSLPSSIIGYSTFELCSIAGHTRSRLQYSTLRLQRQYPNSHLVVNSHPIIDGLFLPIYCWPTQIILGRSQATIAKISHRTTREGVLPGISPNDIAQYSTTSEQSNVQDTANQQFGPESGPQNLSSIVEATTSPHHVLRPDISSKQTYWSCEDFDDDLPSSSKNYPLQKYSSASTVDLDNENSQALELDKCQFNKLVQKYNLYAYVQTDFAAYPPLPKYTESIPSGETLASRTTNNQQEMTNPSPQRQYNENPSLEAMKKTCWIPARLSGFFSLVTQLIVFLVALGLTSMMLYQLGGRTLFGHSSTKNSTDIINQGNGTFPTPMMLEITNLLSNNTYAVRMLTDKDNSRFPVRFGLSEFEWMGGWNSCKTSFLKQQINRRINSVKAGWTDNTESWKSRIGYLVSSVLFLPFLRRILFFLVDVNSLFGHVPALRNSRFGLHQHLRFDNCSSLHFDPSSVDRNHFVLSGGRAIKRGVDPTERVFRSNLIGPFSFWFRELSVATCSASFLNASLWFF